MLYVSASRDFYPYLLVFCSLNGLEKAITIPASNDLTSQLETKGKKEKVVLPFTVKSILELCWGMTLNFSHETSQAKLGEVFEQEFIKIFEQSNTPSDKIFQENLMMALAKTLRDMGFVRDNHVRYLDDLSQELAAKTEFVQGIKNFASTSKSGIFSKAGSFLGVASLSDFLQKYDIVSKQNSSLHEVGLIVMSGIAGLFGIWAILNYWVLRDTIENTKKDILKKQEDYWKNNFKPDMVDLLFQFYKDVRDLIKECYVSYKKEDILTWDEDKVKKFIWNRVLPTDNFYYSGTKGNSAVAPAASS